MSKHFYTAIFTKEETGYSVSFPDLEGCFTEGDTFEEAYNMAVDAIKLWFEDDNLGLFKLPRMNTEINIDKNQIVVLVQI